MKAFTRTKSGLSNLFIFYGVDYIIFTEGGDRSFSLDEVQKGGFNGTSVDIKFWSGVLRKHGCNSRVEFRALGSKKSSREICEMVVRGEVENVIVALDSDFDGVLGKKYKSPFVFYTRGYSWENDVYTCELVKEQLESYLLAGRMPDECEELVENYYQKIMRVLPKIFKIELMFRKQNKKFVSDISSEALIDKKSPPEINFQYLFHVLREKKEALVRPVRLDESYEDVCYFSHCYGKLVEALAISLLFYAARKYAGYRSLPKEIVRAAMLERYERRKGIVEDKYYEEIVTVLR